jgi:hypothetical protein
MVELLKLLLKAKAQTSAHALSARPKDGSAAAG